MLEDFKSFLVGHLTKALVVDLEDRLRAEAVKAHEMVRNHAGLNKKRSRELEGHARFRMMEEGFEAVCKQHGGATLHDGVIPLTELKVFQPFSRFGREGRGVILGLAAMPEPQKLPNRNMSRSAGVSLNYYLTPRLELDDAGPRVGDIFVLLLVARDRARAGKIEEIAIGVVDSGYSFFLFYETLDKFLAGGEDAPTSAPDPTPLGVKLKRSPKPFVPPEQQPKKDDDTGAV
ncbi:hypothetical protein [Prosthecodimorpha hirschii]|uniref:hypothetical protein n=1 Tax=Prosthecodimorpha hirschii TaxID=665126 RepID=UPI00112A9EED|nr:hypothetical protein [Prosthecomicrobium hirschii]